MPQQEMWGKLKWISNNWLTSHKTFEEAGVMNVNIEKKMHNIKNIS